MQHDVIRGASHYDHEVERSLHKLPSRGKGISPLKYTNCEVCISLERKACPLKESLDFHKQREQTFLHCTNSLCQKSQKLLPYKHFRGCCPLAVRR
jgi:hypothetical protein